MRLVCPYCSTPQNVGNEFAGRSVKCAKCGADIPAGSASSEPLAEAIDEVEPARPHAMPTRSNDTPQSSRNRAEQSSIDERKRRLERDEPDRQKTTNSGVGVILAVVAFFMLTCCGGIGYGVYWLYNKAKETINDTVDNLKLKNDRVTQESYDRLTEAMTRAQVEEILGKGRAAVPSDLGVVFRGEAASRVRLDEWNPKVQRNRVVLWQNRDDYLLVAFYPNSDAGRLQLKAFAPATGATSQAGLADDDAFAKKHLLARSDGTPAGKAQEVSADQLIREYLASQQSADAKYRDKLVEVTGGIVEQVKGDTAVVRPSGTKGANRIHVSFKPAMKAQLAQYKPGEGILFQGKCESLAGPNVVVKHAEFME